MIRIEMKGPDSRRPTPDLVDFVHQEAYALGASEHPHASGDHDKATKDEAPSQGSRPFPHLTTWRCCTRSLCVYQVSKKAGRSNEATLDPGSRLFSPADIKTEHDWLIFHSLAYWRLADPQSLPSVVDFASQYDIEHEDLKCHLACRGHPVEVA
jgi:hypothetical protein